MRVPTWLIALVLLAAVAQAALLWGSDVPLGVAGEWSWPRIPFEAPLWTTILTGVASVGLYTLLVGAGARRIQRARPVESAGWLAALFIAGCVWLGVVVETMPGPFGLGRGPFIIFYPRTSGYFLQAREGLEDWPRFLSGYEAELEQGDFLHLGTHPPGLAMGYGLLLKVCRESPAVTDFLLASRPRSVRDGTETLAANESSLLPGFAPADAACLWSASLISLLCAVATIWPLYGLLIRAVDRHAAWHLVALWPLVPSVAIFYPKSDLLYPFFAMLFAWLWMTGWERGVVWRCVAAALLLLMSLLMSLAFLPIAAIVGLASLIQWWRDRCGDDLRLQTSRIVCAGAAVATFLAGTAVFWAACDVNLLNVWRLNYLNHARFYDHNPRTWWKWIVANPLELAVAAGPVVTVLALTGAVRTLKSPIRSSPAFSVLIVWAALWLSGKNMGEAARLWIFLMPWLLIVAASGFRTGGDGSSEATEAAASRKSWLVLISLQAALCISTVYRVDGFHFDELVPLQGDARPVTSVPVNP